MYIYINIYIHKLNVYIHTTYIYTYIYIHTRCIHYSSLHDLYLFFLILEFSSQGNVLGYSPLPDDADAETPKENAQDSKKPSRNGSYFPT